MTGKMDDLNRELQKLFTALADRYGIANYYVRPQYIAWKDYLSRYTGHRVSDGSTRGIALKLAEAGIVPADELLAVASVMLEP